MSYSVIDRWGNKLHYNDHHQCHREDGYAIKYSEEWRTKNPFHDEDEIFGAYFLKNVWIDDRIYKKILNKTLTAKDILNEENIEARRVLIDYYGLDKFIKDSKSKVIAKNEYGTIYCKHFESNWFMTSDEPIVVVKVKNSTPEIDGSYKDYFIRVPPQFGKKKRKWFFLEIIVLSKMQLLGHLV